MWEQLGPILDSECAEPTLESVFGGKITQIKDKAQIITNEDGWKLFYFDRNNRATDTIPFHFFYHYTNVTIRMPVETSNDKGVVILNGETYDKKWKKNKISYE